MSASNDAAPEYLANAPKKPNRAKRVFPLLVLTALAVGLGAWLLGRGKETTDDAQIEGRIVAVASRVAGQVARVLVADNQLVEAGAPVVELDDRELKARLEAAKADRAAAQASLDAATTSLALTQRNAPAGLSQARGGLAQARAGVDSSKAGLALARAAVTAAETRARLARTERDRVQALRAQNAVPAAQFDAAQAGLDEAEAARTQAQAALEAAGAQSQGSTGGLAAAEARVEAAQSVDEQVAAATAAVGVATARVAQTEAAVRLAELQLSYAVVAAPARGIVSRRNVEVGQMVSPERPLLALVPPDDVWIVANFKEDQIVDMRPGEPAEIRVDTYGGRSFRAHVDSLAGASGARFSLLPPDNATGNFVKVVQRIPVLLRFEAPPEVPLRPGMSAVVTVHTGETGQITPAGGG